LEGQLSNVEGSPSKIKSKPSKIESTTSKFRMTALKCESGPSTLERSAFKFGRFPQKNRRDHSVIRKVCFQKLKGSLSNLKKTSSKFGRSAF
jgi:hypothetical protein